MTGKGRSGTSDGSPEKGAASGDGPLRLNKYIADCGVCSRRQADALIGEGRVSVDGTIAVTGQKVLPGQTVTVDGRRISDDGETVLLIFNKPVGVECTTAADSKDNVVRYIGYSRRIYPIGRLDKDSEGLLLMTNRGDLVNGIMRSRYRHEKEYIVKVDKPVTDAFLRGMSSGVPILDTVTRPCRTERIGRSTFRIIITQGLNRQIRRMCQHFGYEVKSLKRVRVLDIELGDLPVGRYRHATAEELESVMRYAGMR